MIVLLLNFEIMANQLTVHGAIGEIKANNMAVWCQYVANGGQWEFDKYIQMYAFAANHITPHPDLEPPKYN